MKDSFSIHSTACTIKSFVPCSCPWLCWSRHRILEKFRYHLHNFDRRSWKTPNEYHHKNFWLEFGIQILLELRPEKQTTSVLCDNYVPQWWVEFDDELRLTMSWVGCWLPDSGLYLISENSQILLKISVNSILLGFMASSEFVSKQPTQLINAVHNCHTNDFEVKASYPARWQLPNYLHRI